MCYALLFKCSNGAHLAAKEGKVSQFRQPEKMLLPRQDIVLTIDTGRLMGDPNYLAPTVTPIYRA